MSDPLGLPSAAQQRRSLALGLVGLALFLAWQALALRSYIRADTRPPSWDQSNHLEIALDYREALKAGRWGDALHLAPKPGMPPFPPLYHLSLMRAYDGPDPAHRALWLNWFYLALLCTAIFAIAFEFKPDGTALAAAVIFGCSPEVLWLLTNQLIDLALAAWVTAAYWALLRSDGFKRWPGALAFGALYAVGMLHKWSFFSYLAPAYYVAAKALSSSESRPKVLVAAVIALAGFTPWYIAHIPVLMPRLVSASADMATPVWQGGAFFTYFLNLSDSFGPPFWLMATVAILVPHFLRNQEKGWILQAWVFTSYLFWAIVPNRQMRFLLPGLPALAVALGAAWPKPAVWVLAGYQLFAGANYLSGWIAPIRIPLPIHSITFLPSDPPAKQDWRIPDILKEAQARAPAGAAVSNLTLVANARYFNGSTFAWTIKQLGLPSIRVRGVNSRLCEFSRFVVLKTGELGPPGVIKGLPEAAKVMQAAGGWFERAYREARRWPLPDGSEAVLFEQRTWGAPPFSDKAFAVQYYEAGPLLATDLDVTFSAWDAASQSYPRMTVSAAQVTLRDLKMEGLAFEMDDVLLIPLKADADSAGSWNDVRLLKLGTLKIKSVKVDAGDLVKFLEKRVKGLKVESLELDKTLKLRATLSHLSLSAEAAVEVDKASRALRIEVLGAKVGVTPVPLWLLGPLRVFRAPLEPSPEMPFFIDLPGVTLADGELTIP